jgi:hypothetical protein
MAALHECAAMVARVATGAPARAGGGSVRPATGGRAFVVRSPEVSSRMLAPDPGRPGVTWLQGLVARESDRCEVTRSATLTLPFVDLYPGEPRTIDVSLDLGWASASGGGPNAPRSAPGRSQKIR